jgi:hypothetical protein
MSDIEENSNGSVEGKSYFCLDLDQLSLLELDEEQRENYHRLEAMRHVKLPINESGDLKEFDLLKAYSWYKAKTNGKLFWLHPEFVDVVEDAKDKNVTNEVAKICKSCRDYLVRTKPQLPPHSAANVQLGSASRLGLPELTSLERMILAKARLFRTVIKVQENRSGPRERSGMQLRGHNILFDHDSFLVAMKELFQASSCQGMVTLQLVGPTGKMDALAEATMKSTLVGIHAHCLYCFGSILLLLNAHYDPESCPPLPAFDDMKRDVQQLKESLIQNAIRQDDEIIVQHEQRMGADIANVRTTYDEAEESDPLDAEEQYNVKPQSVYVCQRKVVSETDENATNTRLLQSIAKQLNTTDGNDNIGANISSSRTSQDDGTADPNSTQQTDTSQTPTAQAPQSIRSEDPMNEFLQGDLIYQYAFPDIFLLGNGYGRKSGSLTLLQRKHLLFQHDGRAQRTIDLIALLFNQLQRHGHIRGVSTWLKGNPAKFKEFVTRFNTDKYVADLHEARKDCTGAVAKRIIREVMPFLVVSGRNVPFGPTEPKTIVSHVYAMESFFGSASTFGTVAPDDICNPTGFRLCHPIRSNSDFPSDATEQFYNALEAGTEITEGVTIPIPCKYYDAFREAQANPVAVARLYIKLIEAITGIALGLDLSNIGGRSRKSITDKIIGIVGDSLGMLGANETTARGALHLHFLLYGGLTPALLQKIAHCSQLKEIVIEIMEQMFRTDLPPALHVRRAAEDQARREDNGFATIGHRRRGTLYVCPPIDDSNIAAYKRHAHLNAATTQFHQHNPTCFKGNMGKTGCRLCFERACIGKSTCFQLSGELDDAGVPIFSEEIAAPATFTPSETYPMEPPDQRMLVWELKRPELKPLPDCDTEDAAALYRTITSNMAEWCTGKIGAFLKRTSLAVLKNIYDAVNQTLPHANGHVVDYNEFLTAVLGCNSAIYPLGNEVQSQSALFYICPYFSKDKAPVERALAVMYNTAKNIDRLKSALKEEDAKTVERKTQRFLCRVLNKLAVMEEVSDVQMAAAVLGLGTEVTTETFEFYDARSLLSYSIFAQEGGFSQCEKAQQQAALTAMHAADLGDEDSHTDGNTKQRDDESSISDESDMDDSSSSSNNSELVDDVRDLQQMLNSQAGADLHSVQTPRPRKRQKTEPDIQLEILSPGNDSPPTNSGLGNINDGTHVHVAADSNTVASGADCDGSDRSITDMYAGECNIPNSALMGETFEQFTRPNMKQHSGAVPDNLDIGRLRAHTQPHASDKLYAYDHSHWHYRGESLRNITPIEFRACFKVVPKSVGKSGESCNSLIDFGDGHPLKMTHVIQLRSKFPMLILCGL